MFDYRWKRSTTPGNSMSSLSSRHPRRRLLKWSLGTLAGIIILAGVLVGLFRVAANLLPRYHDEIQHQVAAQLHAQVAIGPISLVWHGWGPALVFHDLRVRGSDKSPVVIRAKTLRLDFTAWSLVHGTAARPSGFTVIAPRVTLRQRPDGKLVVPGLHLPQGTGPSPLKRMLGDSVTVRDGRLRLELSGKQTKVWYFDNVHLGIDSGLRHSVSLGLSLPKEMGGGRLQVAGVVTTPDINLAHWSWHGHLTLDHLQLGGIDRFLPDSAPPVSGIMALSTEFKGAGTVPASASGQITLDNLTAGQGRIGHFQSAFGYTGDQGQVLTLNDPRVVLPNRAWKPGRLQFSRGKSGRLQFSVQSLPLDILPAFAGFLPRSQGRLGKRLAAMQPSGQVDNLVFSITPGHPDFGMQAALHDVSLKHADNLPGFEHLSARVDIRHGVGRVDVDAPGLTLLMPKLFGHPVALDTVRGPVLVASTPSDIWIGMPRLKLTGPALSGAVKGVIRVPYKGLPFIRLAAYARGANAVAARKHYLPHGLLPKPLNKWLMHSFSGGRLTDARLYFDGPVKTFPYKHGGGYFGVNFGYAGVSLSPGFGWAPMKQLGGRVMFHNAGMRATITHGAISGAHVISGSAAIPDFFNVQLHVHADVAGNAQDFLDFLRNSPVSKQLGGALDPLHANGPTRTKLQLNLPVMHPNKFHLKGELILNGVTARYGRLPFELTAMKGRDTYDGKGPLSGHFSARLKGAPVVLKLGRSRKRNAVLATLAGKLPAKAVASAMKLAPGKYLSGALPLKLTLAVPLTRKGPPISLDLDSSLKGLAIKLPAPLGKSASAAVPVRAHLDIHGSRLVAAARYGDKISGCADIDVGTSAPDIRGLHVLLGKQGCSKAAPGLLVTGGWPELDLGPWMKLVPKGVFSGGGQSRARRFDALAFNLRFGNLKYMRQQFKDEQVSGQLGPQRLQLTFAGKDLAGKAQIPRRPTDRDPIVTQITHGRFAVPAKPVVSAASAATAAVAAVAVGTSGAPRKAVEFVRSPATAPAAATAAQTRAVAAASTASAGKPMRPQDVPPFVLHAGHIRLGDAVFNDVLIKAVRVPGGIFVNPLRVGGGTLDFDGTLVWIKPRGQAGHGQGALKFLAHVHNLGTLLKGVGLGPVVTGHGAASASLAWSEKSLQGASFTDQLLGKVSVDLRDGQISQVNPGAGRLLSLLNLANIPRYLTFNFHNLTGKGFPFSRIHGDYDINQGVATTKGLVIDSSVAWIKLTGSLNLDHQTMNQKAQIEPNYTGSLPIIGALVGGIGVGAAVFAITKIFGGAIAQASQLNYSIRGPFSHPLVKPVGETPAPPAATRGRGQASGGSR